MSTAVMEPERPPAAAGIRARFTTLRRQAPLLFVLGAALLVYANSLWNGFAYDDVPIIVQNARVHRLADLGGIWLTPYWPTFGSELGLYRPFTIFMFALQWVVADGSPWLFHLVNILLHVGICALVFFLLRRLFTRAAAFAGALAFAVHPLHTEAVANVVGQGELWAAAGVLGACLLYATRPAGEFIGRARLALLAVLYAVALLAKEGAVVLPGLLVLLDVVQGRVTFSRTGLSRYLNAAAFPLALLCLTLAAYLTLRLSVLGNLTGSDVAPALPHLYGEHRWLNALRAWPEFVRLLFFPVDLSVHYAPAVLLPVETFTFMTVLGMLLVAVTVALTLTTPWRPRAGAAPAWWLITILPIANFFFPIGVLIAERTLYLPSVAVAILAGLAWEAATRSPIARRRRLAVMLAVAVIGLLGVRTVLRNPDWASLNAIWDAVVRDHPESYHAQWANAVRAQKAGKPELAEQHYILAYRIWPHDSQLLSDFGNYYINRRQFDRAVFYFERSRRLTPYVPRTLAYLSYAYLLADRPRDALSTALEATGMSGGPQALVYAVLGAAYERLGRYGESAGAWAQATKHKSGNNWVNWAMLARALARAGAEDRARTAVDVARNKTGANARLLGQLEAAIREGCYRSVPSSDNGARPACDPLKDWQFAQAETRAPGAIGAPARSASDLQNAILKGPGAASPGSGPIR